MAEDARRAGTLQKLALIAGGHAARMPAQPAVYPVHLKEAQEEYFKKTEEVNAAINGLHIDDVPKRRADVQVG